MKCRLGPLSGGGGGCPDSECEPGMIGKSVIPSSGVVNVVPYELFPAAFSCCSRAKRLGVIVTTLPLLPLLVELTVRRRGRAMIGASGGEGMLVDGGIREGTGSGEERAV